MSAPKPARPARPGDDGEDATATVELAILLPVYMMLFVGLLTIGHLVLIRQKVVEAVRFQAWLPGDTRTNNNGGVTNNFFATYQPFANGPGYAQLTKTVAPFAFDDAGIFQGVYQNFNATQAQRSSRSTCSTTARTGRLAALPDLSRTIAARYTSSPAR